MALGSWDSTLDAKVTDGMPMNARPVLFAALASVGFAYGQGQTELAPPKPTISACDPQVVWDRVVEAKGGRARLASVESFAVAWRSQRRKLFGTELLEWSTFYVLPDYFWDWTDTHDARFGRRASVSDAKKQVQIMVGAGSRSVDRRRLVGHPWQKDFFMLLSETKWAKPVISSCRVDPAEPGSYLLDALPPEGKAGVAGDDDPSTLCFHVDVSSGMILRLDEIRRGYKVVWDLGDYTPVGGIMLPSRCRRTDSIDQIRFQLQYEINPKYDPAFLQRDPSADEGPEPWRPGRTTKSGKAGRRR